MSDDAPHVTRVLVVAPYPSVRAGLRAMLERAADIVVVAESADGEVSVPLTPDALVIDLDPDQAGLPDSLHEQYPAAAQVLLIDGADTWQRIGERALERPTAILLKDAAGEEIAAALRAATQGLVVLDPTLALNASVPQAANLTRDDDVLDVLTERERQVLELLALGLPNKTIAMELGISEHTAKFHVGAIMSKLGAASRTEAVAIAARRGLLVL